MPEVIIERLGHQGDGIATGPIFVARTLPGEVIEGEIIGDRIVDPRIVTPSTSRVSPLCRHYKSCGGCSLQHASDDFVLDWQKDVVARALNAVGLDAPLRRMHTSPPSSRRRATFGGRRTKKGAIIGFHAPGSDTLVATPDCQIVRRELLAVFPVLEDITKIGGSRKSTLKLSVTETETGLDISVQGGKPLDIDLRQSLVHLANDDVIARISWDEEVIAQKVAPILTFGSAPVPIPPGAFLQATEQGSAALLDSVTEAVDGANKVLDLFAGCGTFSLPIAKTAAVHAVENDDALLSALDAGWRHAGGVQLVTTEKRDLFRRPMTPDELERFDAIIVDPPRAGAEAQTIEIAAANVQRIAAVSCNPVTFARDAAILSKSGYTIDWIDIVDQFRWSTHIELAASFSRH